MSIVHYQNNQTAYFLVLLYKYNVSSIFSSECQWKFKLSENDLESDFVLRCDHFDVGRAQESGRCWGDALVIYGDSNSVLRNRKHSRKIDHLSLCGRYFSFCMFSIRCI